MSIRDSILRIRMKPAEAHIHADRRLAFEVLTAFGASSSAEKANPRVLSKENGRLLVEFHSHYKSLLGGEKTVKTVEWVTLSPPERIDFEGVRGPLAFLRDRFSFTEEGNCTRLRYESEFGLRWWLLGWLISTLLVKPILRRFMRNHMREMKATIEERAKRSRVYPQKPCLGENKTEE